MRSGDTQISCPDGQLPVYISVPEEANGVCIIVLQEIFGVNANIRAIADSFAASGYIAVAPELYWRQRRDVRLDPSQESDRATAMELMAGLNRDQSVADAKTALDWVREQFPTVRRSAAVGYCFGGGIAYLLAVRAIVDLGISYYGTGLQGMLSELHGLRGQLLLHLAGQDHLCPPEAQAAIQSAADEIPGRVHVQVYPGAGHAFAREGGATFDKAAADKANGMTMELLHGLVDDSQT